MNRLVLAAGSLAVLGGCAVGTYVGLVTGRLSFDLGVGRRVRPLGPLHVDVQAARDVVYDVAAAPYAERRPRALREKVDILERDGDTVLAAHRTPVGGGLTAVTVETVTFDPPKLISFRLVRGPVPYVTETFTLEETATGTRLTYAGELGTDLGVVGERWGDVVQRSWVAAVRESLASIRSESERRASVR